MATWVDFKELRANLKIIDVLNMYNVQLKVKGDRATGFCPLPQHKGREDGKKHSPSFSVHLGKGIFHCFSCGASGNCLELAIFLAGGSPDDPAFLRKTALELNEKLRTGIVSVATSHARDAEDAKVQPNYDPSGPFVVNAPLDFELKNLDVEHPYLFSRGFTKETIEHFGLGYCGKGMMAGRIAIPLHDAGSNLIGYAGRLVDDSRIDDEHPKYRFPGTRTRKGVTHIFRKGEFLYNAHSLNKPVNDLIIVEGFASTWWLRQNGFPSVVAAMGNRVSVRQVEELVSIVDSRGRIRVMPDSDPAGLKLALDALPLIAKYRSVRWIELASKQPTDCPPCELHARLRG